MPTVAVPWRSPDQGAAQRRWANRPTNIRLAPTTKTRFKVSGCTLAADNAIGTYCVAPAPTVERPAASPRRPRQLGR